jgi:monofunctional biosynthetic peptidoglycan transglycosylase
MRDIDSYRFPHSAPRVATEKARPHDPATPRTRRRRRIALALLGALLGAGVLLWYVVVPYPRTMDTRNPEITGLMEQRIREAGERGAPYEIRQEWVALEDVSPALVRAVVVAEDYRFRQHRGVDWVSLAEEVRWTGSRDFSWTSPSDLGALREAVAYAWTNRDELRGRSSITQQLAKNLYFGTERTLVRKGLEFLVAGRLERKLDKDRILELYLNLAEWGPGLFGAEAASWAYFARPASALTIEQAAELAATLPHPLTSNPAYSPRRMLRHKESILDRIDPTRHLPPTPAVVDVPSFEVDLDIEVDPESLTGPSELEPIR